VNAKEKDKIKTLRRRADYLTERITSNPDKTLSFDFAERKAILWAIEKIEQMEEAAA
jgi:hypothetical protein